MEDLHRVLDAVEKTHRVEDLKARLEADEKAGRRNRRFDGAQGDALDRARDLPELVGGIDLDFQLAARAALRPGLERLHPFEGDVIRGRRRKLHGELLCIGSRGAREAGCGERQHEGRPPPLQRVTEHHGGDRDRPERSQVVQAQPRQRRVRPDRVQ